MFEQGDIISDQYRVDRVLGRGATAVTYLVTDLHYGGQFVLKRILRDDCCRALAGTEFRALQSLHHPAIVRVHDVRPPNDEFHLKLEFVSGPSLEELDDDFPWSLDRTHDLARRLLDACEYLAEQGICHRDISPKNIIVSDVGAKLIDFGVARTDAASGITMVGTPRYRAPEIDTGEVWDASCDTYSASVVLFRVLTGTYPFAVTDTSADKHQMVEVATLGLDEKAAEYAQVLQQGCHPDRARRMGSARELLRALEAVIQSRPVVEEGEWVDNPLVTDLQAVYKNSRTGNADNRGLDTEFAERTYVRTLLDERLVPEIMEGDFLLVLLTGNPGDGKTAFLEHVRRKLEGLGANFEFENPNGWRAGLNGRVYTANYDASESHKGRHANEILDEMLAPLAGPLPPKNITGFTALLAINDGRLRDYFLHNNRYGWLGNVIYHKLRGKRVDREPRVALVDLKSRCLTAESSTGSSLFERVLLAILKHPGWATCEGCKARSSCVIRFNRDTLIDERNGAVVRARLAGLFHLTHLRGVRHTTIRDLRSALSYVIAGVRGCTEIHEEVQSGVRSDGWQDALYFNAVFNPAGELDDELEDLADYDVGRYPTPRWGRFLHYNRGSEKRKHIDEVLLPGFGRSSNPMSGLTYAALRDEWYRVMKRVLYFEMDEARVRESDWRLPPPADLLPYRHAETFQKIVSGAVEPEQVRDWLCDAISASDGIVAPSVRAGHLCVRTAYREELEFTVFKRYPADKFTCRVVTPTDVRFIETCPNTIEFVHMDGDPSLRVHLDLFELLMRMREGYVPDVLEWQPYLVDLGQFKTRLQRLRSDEVVLMESGRVLHRVLQRDGKLIREPITSGGETA
ncbi:MAG: serine/threonine protein kinase [Armatimonadetes bacterium]|nr:serine/threonine protein kinase [Armatimonadota bacterium]